MNQKNYLTLFFLILLSSLTCVSAQSQTVASFDDLTLAPESFWQGYENSDEIESVFNSGSYSFSNTYYPDWMYWGGFAYSNVTDTSFDPNEFMTHQFRSVVGHGANNSANYALVYTMGARTDIGITSNPTEGEVVAGVYLTNAAYTYNSMMSGDAYVGDPFKTGDFYKVIFTGTNDKGEKSTVEHYLADYRSENEAEHYVLTDWKWFDLSALGKVVSVRVTVDGSRKGDYGLNTPAYLCMDDFGSKNQIANSIETNQQAASLLTLYPTLAKDVLNIKSSVDNYTIKIYSTTGALVYQQGGSDAIQVDVSTLKLGMYLLEMTSKGGKETKRFIKN